MGGNCTRVVPTTAFSLLDRESRPPNTDFHRDCFYTPHHVPDLRRLLKLFFDGSSSRVHGNTLLLTCPVTSLRKNMAHRRRHGVFFCLIPKGRRCLGQKLSFFVFWGRAASAPLALSSRAWTGSYPFFFFFSFSFFTRCSCKWNDWGCFQVACLRLLLQHEQAARVDGWMDG